MSVFANPVGYVQALSPNAALYSSFAPVSALTFAGKPQFTYLQMVDPKLAAACMCAGPGHQELRLRQRQRRRAVRRAAELTQTAGFWPAERYGAKTPRRARLTRKSLEKAVACTAGESRRVVGTMAVD